MNITERFKAIHASAVNCGHTSKSIDRIIDLSHEGATTQATPNLTPAQQNADKMLVLLKAIRKALDGKAAPLTKTTMQVIDMIVDDIEPQPITIDAMAATMRLLIGNPSPDAIETAQRLLARLDRKLTPIEQHPFPNGNYYQGCISKKSVENYNAFKNAGWSDAELITHKYMA